VGQSQPALKVNYLRSWLGLTMSLLIICYLLNLVMGLPRAGLPRVLTDYVGASEAQMSLVQLFFFGVGKCLTDLLAGWMTDHPRGGRKVVVLLGGTLTALGCLCIYLAVPGDISEAELTARGQHRETVLQWGPFVLIGLGQFLNGLGSGFQNQGIMVATQDLGGRMRRGLAGGLMEAALYWGVTAGTFLGGWLVALSGQVLFPFLIMAVIAIACTVAASRTVDTRKAILEPAGVVPQPVGWRAYRLAFTNRSLYVIYFAGLMSKWIDSLIIVVSSKYLQQLNYSLEQTAVIQTGFVLSWSTLSLFTGALSDTIGRKNLIWSGMLWSAVFTLVLLHFSVADNLAWQLTLTVLLGCGTGFYYGLPPAIAADVAPLEYRGVCISVYRFWRDTGNIVSTLVFAGIFSLWGKDHILQASETILLVSAVLLFVGAAIAWLFMQETYLHQETPNVAPAAAKA
jgi:MFS family permease